MKMVELPKFCRDQYRLYGTDFADHCVPVCNAFFCDVCPLNQHWCGKYCVVFFIVQLWYSKEAKTIELGLDLFDKFIEKFLKRGE